MTHNDRCANAKTDVKYCKCSCGGRLHGGVKHFDRKDPHYNRLQVGDMVRINPTTELKNRQNVVCFVEDLLGNRFARGQANLEQVSLYSVDGEYVGDWFEDEFVELGRKISVEELKALIEKFKDQKGLVKDFERVLQEIQGKKEVAIPPRAEVQGILATFL